VLKQHSAPEEAKVSGYSVDVIEAACGCRFQVGASAVAREVEMGVFELVSQEQVVALHEMSCLADQNRGGEG
jgi:hypothetical protein